MDTTTRRPDGRTDWKQRRLDVRLSLRETSRRSGVNHAYISLIERGRMVPTPDQAARLLETYDAVRGALLDEAIATGGI